MHRYLRIIIFNNLQMTTDKDNNSNFKDVATEMADKCTQDGKFAMANQYSTTISALNTIFGKTEFEKLTIEGVDYAFVEKVIKYGKEEVKKKNTSQPRWSDATIKVHLKIIKAVISYVYKQTKGLPSSNPFSDEYDHAKHVEQLELPQKLYNSDDIAKPLQPTESTITLSKALGHNNVTTTDKYLETLNREEKSK